MAIRGVNLNEREEWISPDDPGNPEHPEYKKAKADGKDTEEPTIFYIGNMTGNDRVRLGDMTTSPSMSEGTIRMESQNVRRCTEVVRAGLKGWDNMMDHEGNVINFLTETGQNGVDFAVYASGESMMHLGQTLILQLADAIMEKNGLSESLEKKLERQSQQYLAKTLQTGDAKDAPQTSEKSAGAKKVQKES